VKRFVLVFALVVVLAGVVVSAASALRFDDAHPCVDTEPVFVCPSGAVGQPYSIQLVGAGGCGPALPYQYRLLNGALPRGLSMTSGGLISGVPKDAGTAQFWVELSDENPPSQSWCIPKTAQRLFSITVQPGLSINQNSVPGGTLGQAYSQTLTATQVSSTDPVTGPQVNATWSVKSGTPPPGITLSASGALSGTPTTEGSYQFVVQAVNGGISDTETYTITVRQPVVVSLAPQLPKSEVGVDFNSAVKVSGGSGTYTLALAGGALPTGVAFDATTGGISGTPTAAGKFAFSISATDSEGRVTTLDATVVVATKLSFKTLALKAAKVGKLYRATLKTIGGVQPVKWKATGGKLPRGIRFDKKLGVFSGTTKRAGTYRVSVQVTDALHVTSKKTFVLVVKG
jgi:large repetitive protein